MQTDNTLVSIISPAYNSAKTIDATIRSVLAQTYPHWEMLIADDGSKDDTVERVRAYDDSRIRLLINEKNMGPAATRNRLISEARGRYIAFLDTDDEWLPAKLERQLQLLQQTGDGIGCTGYRRRFPNKTIDLIPPARIRYQDMLKTNHIPMLTAIIDRTVHPHIEFAHKGHEDYQLWLELTRDGDHCRTFWPSITPATPPRYPATNFALPAGTGASCPGSHCRSGASTIISSFI